MRKILILHILTMLGENKEQVVCAINIQGEQHLTVTSDAINQNCQPDSILFIEAKIPFPLSLKLTIMSVFT